MGRWPPPPRSRWRGGPSICPCVVPCAPPVGCSRESGAGCCAWRRKRVRWAGARLPPWMGSSLPWRGPWRPCRRPRAVRSWRHFCPRCLPLSPSPSAPPWRSWRGSPEGVGALRRPRPCSCRQGRRRWLAWPPRRLSGRCKSRGCRPSGRTSSRTSSGRWPWHRSRWSGVCWRSCFGSCRPRPACGWMPMGAGTGTPQRAGRSAWRASPGWRGWSSPWLLRISLAWRPWPSASLLCRSPSTNRFAFSLSCAGAGGAGRCAGPPRTGIPGRCWLPWSATSPAGC